MARGSTRRNACGTNLIRREVLIKEHTRMQQALVCEFPDPRQVVAFSLWSFHAGNKLLLPRAPWDWTTWAAIQDACKEKGRVRGARCMTHEL